MVMSMATFDVNEFVAHPALNQFHKCGKSDLREIAEHYCILVSSSLAKKELNACFWMDYLVREFSY